MQAEGQNQKLVSTARHGDGEVVVDTLFKLVQYCQTMGCGEVNFGLGQRIVRAGSADGVNGHIWHLKKLVFGAY